MVPVDRVGLYVPGGLAPLVSRVVMNVVPAQVAGVRSIALSSPPQKDTRPAGPGHPGGLRAPRRRGGVRRRRRTGDRDVRLRRRACAGSTWSPVRATSTSTAAKRLLKRRRRHRLRGRADRDRDPGRRHAEAAYVAADLISQAEHDPLAAVGAGDRLRELADEVEAELDKQVVATRHIERIRTALAGQQSGIVLVDDIEQGLDVVNAYAAEHLEIHTARRRRVAARVRNAGAIFVGPWAPVSPGRLLRRLQPRAAHRRLRLPLLRAVGALVPQGGARRRLHPRRRSPRWPATWSRWPRPRTCPATAPAVACGSTERPADDASRRCGRSCAASSPTARPQLDVPVQLNVNENPYGPSAECVADIAARRRRGGGAR